MGGAAVVKNEADIIEAFVRHNLCYVDELHVVDNGSTDGTWEILTTLDAELSNLSIGRDRRTDHPQEHLMSGLLVHWSEPLPDWVFCLDADEFIDARSPQAFRATVAEWPVAECMTLMWEFFVPTAADDAAEVNPIRRITHRRADDPADGMLSKVVVPRRFLRQPELRVRAGNHFVAQTNGVVLPHPIADAPRLAHFPIRSHDQVAKKAVIGAWAVSSRSTRDPNEASHWEDLKARVLEGEVLDADELANLAYNYSVSERLPAVSRGDFVLARRPLATSVSSLTVASPGRQRAFGDDVIAFADEHFTSLQRVAVATEGMSVVKTNQGLMALTSATPAGQAAVLRGTGDWAHAEVEFCIDAVHAGELAWDLGAGVGYQSVALARRVGGEGTVVAVEPDSALRQDLATNLTLNELRNVVIAQSLDEVLPAESRAGARRLRRVVRRRQPDGPTSAAAAPALIRIGVMTPGLLARLTAVVARVRPRLFLTAAKTADYHELLAWGEDSGYRWWWFISAADGAHDGPRAALVGVPTVEPVPPGLQPLASADDTWAAAWHRQERQFNSPPVRWALARHGLAQKWH
ncbi:MAG: hypothetical protein QG597_3440 [Actinomycetota bacterium]|nr:hypothetical protein [Actinomycetota bacterium]